MTELTRVGDLDVPQDLRYERRAYRVRQVAALFFALVLAAGLLGLLGRSGPLSDTTAAAGGDLAVAYQRFLRLQSPTELDIRIGAGQDETNIAISQDLLQSFRVESFSAEPQDTTVLADRVVYTFDQQPPSRVTVVLDPRRIGRQRGTIYGPGDAAVRISQWVWP